MVACREPNKAPFGVDRGGKERDVNTYMARSTRTSRDARRPEAYTARPGARKPTWTRTRKNRPPRARRDRQAVRRSESGPGPGPVRRAAPPRGASVWRRAARSLRRASRGARRRAVAGGRPGGTWRLRRGRGAACGACVGHAARSWPARCTCLVVGRRAAGRTARGWRTRRRRSRSRSSCRLSRCWSGWTGMLLPCPYLVSAVVSAAREVSGGFGGFRSPTSKTEKETRRSLIGGNMNMTKPNLCPVPAKTLRSSSETLSEHI